MYETIGNHNKNTKSKTVPFRPPIQTKTQYIIKPAGVLKPNSIHMIHMMLRKWWF